MTNQTAVAEVVVLTATVRALMVGSRQITLSVFAQLDEVEWDECHPMGRVRPRNDSGHWVIGADASGDLVRARVLQPDHLRRRELQQIFDRYQRGGYMGPPYRNIEEVAHELEGHQQDMQTSREQQAVWDQLPLIVLAGLR